MKINDVQRVSGITPHNRSTEQRQADAAGKRGKQRDEVQFSAEARELLETQDNGATSEQRTEKLRELKDSVNGGTYHVEARRIAEKLLPYLK